MTAPRIPWLRVCVESLAIVASILLAFAIDAWWESRGRAAELDKTLSTLEGDFRTYSETPAETPRLIDNMVETGTTRRDLVEDVLRRLAARNSA